MSLPSTRLGLKSVTALVVDDNPQSLDVPSAILMGFGVNKITRCQSAVEARAALGKQAFDLMIVDWEMPEQDGLSLVRQVRQDATGPNFTVPIIMVSADTHQVRVEAGRDHGANYTVAKPVSPTVMLERVLWVARSQRGFVSGETYRSPDRRFHTVPLPEGQEGRRASDRMIAAQPERALSQDEIDGLFS